MVIKIAERCQVEREAVTRLMVEIARQVAEVERGKIASAYNERLYRQANAARLRRIAQLAGEHPAAIEAELGAMYNLPYERVGVHERNDKTYLYGLTRPVVMEQYDGSKALKPEAHWDIGRYMVFVDSGLYLGKGIAGNLHLLPERDSRAYGRHPHHRGHADRDTHPLDAGSSTCTDGFGGVLLMSRDELSFSELLRQLYMFLTRYNTRSPLVRPAIQPWMVKVG